MAAFDGAVAKAALYVRTARALSAVEESPPASDRLCSAQPSQKRDRQRSSTDASASSASSAAKASTAPSSPFSAMAHALSRSAVAVGGPARS